MTPRLDLAKRHVELLTSSASTVCCFRLLPVLPYKRSKLVGTITELWPQIETAQGEDKQSVFIVVNGGGHAAASIDRLRALFIDCDGTAEPPTAWHVEPDFLIHRDATHWHAYWRLDIAKSDAELWKVVAAQWSNAQRRLAAHYDTDTGVHDLPRLMRLAGSVHLKDPAHPYLVLIEPRRAGAPRSGPELMAGIPLLPEPSVRPAPSPASGEPVSLEIVRDILTKLTPDRRRDTLPRDVGWRDLIVSIMSAPGPDPVELRELAHDWMSCELHPDLVIVGDYRGEEEVDHIIKTMPPKGEGIGFGTLVKIARAADPPYRGPISIADAKRLEVRYAQIITACGGGAPPVRQPVHEASQASTELARRRVTEEKQLAAERARRWGLA